MESGCLEIFTVTNDYKFKNYISKNLLRITVDHMKCLNHSFRNIFKI